MKQFARRLPPPSPLRMARVLQAAGLALATAGVLGLGGCASSTDASLIHLPDGQSGYAINCSGADASTTWASCYVLAGEKCGATGYTIVSKDNERKADHRAAASPTWYRRMLKTVRWSCVVVDVQRPAVKHVRSVRADL